MEAADNERSIQQRQLQDFVLGVQARLRFPGLSVAVWSGGELLQAAAGLRDVSTGLPLTTHSYFELGSINQFLTALVVLDLVAAGRVDLDERVSTYLPELASANGDRILIRYLLSHTAGYRCQKLANPEVVERMSYDDVVASIRERPLLFKPGTVFDHSWSGAVLLSRVVQAVTSQDVARLAREGILAPLGASDPPCSTKECVAGHRLDGGVIQNEGREPRSELCRHSLFGMATTIGDLALLGGAIVTDSRVFASGSIRSLLTRAVGLPPSMRGDYAEEPFYAFTLGCAQYSSGRFGVSSTLDHRTCALRFDVERCIAVAVGINANAACYRDRILNELLDAFALEDLPPPLEARDSSGAFSLSELIGEYEGAGNRSFTASLENDRLVLAASYDVAEAWEPDTNFFLLDRDDRGHLTPSRALGRCTLGFFRDPVSSAPCLQFGVNAFRKRSHTNAEGREVRVDPPSASAGRLTVAADVARARLDICSGCKNYWKMAGVCGVCHCVMRWKVLFSRSTCPEGKW